MGFQERNPSAPRPPKAIQNKVEIDGQLIEVRGQPHARRCEALHCPCYEDGFAAGKEEEAQYLLDVAEEIRAIWSRHND